MSRALPKPPNDDDRSEPSEATQREAHELSESFKRWVEVGFDGPTNSVIDLPFSLSEEDPLQWFADNDYDGETVRLVGSQRSGLSDKTVTMLRLVNYWRRSVEKLVVQKQSFLRWLEWGRS